MSFVPASLMAQLSLSSPAARDVAKAVLIGIAIDLAAERLSTVRTIVMTAATTGAAVVVFYAFIDPWMQGYGKPPTVPAPSS